VPCEKWKKYIENVWRKKEKKKDYSLVRIQKKKELVNNGNA
jgi:hypothetical protein